MEFLKFKSPAAKHRRQYQFTSSPLLKLIRIPNKTAITHPECIIPPLDTHTYKPCLKSASARSRSKKKIFFTHTYTWPYIYLETRENARYTREQNAIFYLAKSVASGPPRAERERESSERAPELSTGNIDGRMPGGARSKRPRPQWAPIRISTASWYFSFFFLLGCCSAQVKYYMRGRADGVREREASKLLFDETFLSGDLTLWYFSIVQESCDLFIILDAEGLFGVSLPFSNFLYNVIKFLYKSYKWQSLEGIRLKEKTILLTCQLPSNVEFVK